MVFALAGDSTITKFFAIFLCFLAAKVYYFFCTLLHALTKEKHLRLQNPAIFTVFLL